MIKNDLAYKLTTSSLLCAMLAKHSMMKDSLVFDVDIHIFDMMRTMV